MYVNDNTASANTIAAFDRHADGSLTPVPGSPFPAGGAGTGAGLASQGALQITDNGRYLVAVDAGSNQLSVLRIHRDGSLQLVRDGVVSSGGVLPVSVAIHHRLVYVANAGSVGPQLHRVHPRPPRPPLPSRRLDRHAARRLPARRCAVQRRWTQARRNTRGNLEDRQLHGRMERPPEGRAGIAVPRPGARPVRQRVPSHQPGSAVRLKRA